MRRIQKQYLLFFITFLFWFFLLNNLLFFIPEYIALNYEKILFNFVCISLFFTCLHYLYSKHRRISRISAYMYLSGFLAALSVFILQHNTCEKIVAFYTIRTPWFHHANPPQKNMFQGIFEEKKVYIKTNEHGFRTEYSRNAFIKQPFRVAIMGDSFAFGFGVRQEKICSEIAQNILSKSGSNTAILNTGTISYSPFIYTLLYRKTVHLYSPDIVILLLDATDIGDDWIYSEIAAKKGKSVYFSEDDFNYYRVNFDIDGYTEKSRFFIYRYPLEKTKKYFDFTWKQILSLYESVKSDNAQFILVLSPRYHHWNPAECPENWEKEYSVNEKYQYEFFRYFEEKDVDFPIISLLDSFKKEKPPLVFKNDPHWNESGHTVAGKELAHIIEHYKKK